MIIYHLHSVDLRPTRPPPLLRLNDHEKLSFSILLSIFNRTLNSENVRDITGTQNHRPFFQLYLYNVDTKIIAAPVQQEIELFPEERDNSGCRDTCSWDIPPCQER